MTSSPNTTKLYRSALPINDPVGEATDVVQKRLATLQQNLEKRWTEVPSPAQTQDRVILSSAWIETILGLMIAISDEEGLYLLDFADGRHLDKKIDRLREQKNAAILPGDASPITRVKRELELYFAGKLTGFETPIHLMGSDFQKKAWHALRKILYGETLSYLQQAKAIGNQKAYRAVANANGANRLAILIPCHRIINHNGQLGGVRRRHRP